MVCVHSLCTIASLWTVTGDCLEVVCPRCKCLYLAREETMLVKSSCIKLRASLGWLQTGFKMGWLSLGPCAGHQVCRGPAGALYCCSWHEVRASLMQTRAWLKERTTGG